jgi:hypothetical protein
MASRRNGSATSSPVSTGERSAPPRSSSGITRRRVRVGSPGSFHGSSKRRRSLRTETAHSRANSAMRSRMGESGPSSPGPALHSEAFSTSSRQRSGISVPSHSAGKSENSSSRGALVMFGR